MSITSSTKVASEKSHENRVRRAAERQGLALRKCPRRDPQAIGYGTFEVRQGRSPYRLVVGNREHGYGLTLEQVERWLATRQPTQ